MTTKTSRKSEVSMGLAALAAAALGVYFLSGERNINNRKKVKGWVFKMKGEVLERMEQMKDMNEQAYGKIIGEVSKLYRGAKNIDPKELNLVVKELRGHWRHIQKQIKEGGMPKKRQASKKKT